MLILALADAEAAQSRRLAQPTITVTARYPGANCEVVADTVAVPIEQQLNGDGLDAVAFGQ
jgi:multidrug efflux pump subunit AcrB